MNHGLIVWQQLHRRRNPCIMQNHYAHGAFLPTGTLYSWIWIKNRTKITGKHPVMEVSRPGLVSRLVSRPDFAGLDLVSVSGLEILISVSVLCSKGLGFAQSNLPRPPRPQKLCFKNNHRNSILKTAKWWSTKKISLCCNCDRQSLALFIWTHYAGSLHFGAMSSWVTSIVMSRWPVQVYCALCV